MSARDDILTATLRNVAFDGWSERALLQGAEDAGMSAEAVSRAFPQGVADLVSAFSDWADRAMIEAFAARDTADLKTRDKVALAIRLRLEALAPHREAVRRLNSYFALPLNAPQAARLIARTVDAVWYSAGDRATDFSYYTKRGLLTAVYGATVLYWLADESEGAKATWNFLDRRLDDTLRLPRLRHELGGILDRFPNPARMARLARRSGRFRT
jgi:ubiquinone biosynthesis protein COQ9